MSMSVSPHARDITIHLTDSCNWCCWCPCLKKEPAEDTLMYINSKGVATKFNPKVALNRIESLERSLANFHQLVDGLVEANRDKEEEIKGRVKQIIPPKSPTHAPVGITYGMVQRVNDILKSYL